MMNWKNPMTLYMSLMQSLKIGPPIFQNIRENIIQGGRKGDLDEELEKERSYMISVSVKGCNIEAL